MFHDSWTPVFSSRFQNFDVDRSLGLFVGLSLRQDSYSVLHEVRTLMAWPQSPKNFPIWFARQQIKCFLLPVLLEIIMPEAEKNVTFWIFAVDHAKNISLLKMHMIYFWPMPVHTLR